MYDIWDCSLIHYYTKDTSNEQQGHIPLNIRYACRVISYRFHFVLRRLEVMA